MACCFGETGRFASFQWLYTHLYPATEEKERGLLYHPIRLLSYIYEMFAVEVLLRAENSKGEAFPIMQKLMLEESDLVLIYLNMLRLSYFGEPVDFMALAFASSDDQVKIESLLMRENSTTRTFSLRSWSSSQWFDHYANDPYALANIEELVQYGKTRSQYQQQGLQIDESSPKETWYQLSMLLSVADAKLRARGVDLYFRRHRLGEEKERFQADVDNFSRQLSNKSIPSFPLTRNGEEITKKEAYDLSYDGYIALIRKTDFTLQYRRDALRYFVAMCTKMIFLGVRWPLVIWVQ